MFFRDKVGLFGFVCNYLRDGVFKSTNRLKTLAFDGDSLEEH